jgi:hypothetical protein
VDRDKDNWIAEVRTDGLKKSASWDHGRNAPEKKYWKETEREAWKGWT